MRIEPGESLTRLYRAWRCQARLFAYDWEEPYLYAAHSYYARSVMQDMYDAQVHARDQSRNVKDHHARTEKRIVLCKKHIRQLSDANLGWPHAVERALDRAYGRRGKIRHDLLSLVVPPHPSPAVGDEAQYPPRQRLPYLSPTLYAILLSSAAQRTTPAKRSTLECPPKLRIARDSTARIPGKDVGRRRVANAHWRYVTNQIQKLRMPLGLELGANESYMTMVHTIEQKAHTKGPSVPRRVKQIQNIAENLPKDRISSSIQQKGNDSGVLSTMPKSEAPVLSPRKPRDREPIYLRSARHAAHLYGSKSESSMQSFPQRPHGWKSAPKNYAKKPRARRRQWARLLARIPILTLHRENSRLESGDKNETLSSKATTHDPTPRRSRRPQQKPWQPAHDALQLAHTLTQEQDGNSASSKISLRLSNDAVTGGQSPLNARSPISQQEAAWLLRDDRE